MLHFNTRSHFSGTPFDQFFEPFATRTRPTYHRIAPSRLFQDNFFFPHFPRIPRWHLHFTTTIDNCAQALQKTSLKIQSTKPFEYYRITWQAPKGNESFREYFNERLSSKEKSWSKNSDLLSKTSEAKKFVNLAADEYEKLKSPENRMNEVLTTLLKEKPEECAEHIASLKGLLLKVKLLNLPEQLTLETVNQYINDSHKLVSECESYLNDHKEFVKIANPIVENSPIKENTISTALPSIIEDVSEEFNKTVSLSQQEPVKKTDEQVATSNKPEAEDNSQLPLLK